MNAVIEEGKEHSETCIHRFGVHGLSRGRALGRAGQLTKMANQISIAEMVQGPPEGLDFTRRTSLDGKLVVEVISKGAAGSWQMSNRGETMVDDEFDFGFAVDWMCKDLAIVITQAKKRGAQLSLTVLVG